MTAGEVEGIKIDDMPEWKAFLDKFGQFVQAAYSEFIYIYICMRVFTRSIS